MPDNKDDIFNRELVQQLASSSLREQRARRRWSVFFKFLFFTYLITVTVFYYQADSSRDRHDDGKHAAIIAINGTITAEGDNSSDNINSLLRNAFNNEHAEGIILAINSPGGSAVESNRIYNEIRRLRKKHPEKPLIAVAGDFCASGGYFIAAAADNIYADPASIIGSIGVIFSGFGFVGAMEKLGVERRVVTAGSNKNLLDPFLPQNADDEKIIDTLLQDVHALFKNAVIEGRGDRLTNDSRLFDGTLFSGQSSVELGLIDGFNDTGGVARDIIGVDNIIYYQQRDWVSHFIGKFNKILAPTYSSGVRASVGH
ncbi:MAG: S49 family peptidase [Proteobacteria bacterium]|nr:S49 family peptidase [Pseudomonadota bacterium]